MDCSLPGSPVHGDSPGKNTGVDCHSLLQGIFPTQGLNPGLPHCRWILYHLSHQGSPVCMYAYTFMYCNYSIIFVGFCWPPQGVRIWYMDVCRASVLGIFIYSCKIEKKICILMQNTECFLLRELHFCITILRTAAVDTLISPIAVSHLLCYQVSHETFTEPQLCITQRRQNLIRLSFSPRNIYFIALHFWKRIKRC